MELGLYIVLQLILFPIMIALTTLIAYLTISSMYLIISNESTRTKIIAPGFAVIITFFSVQAMSTARDCVLLAKQIYYL